MCDGGVFIRTCGLRRCRGDLLRATRGLIHQASAWHPTTAKRKRGKDATRFDIVKECGEQEGAPIPSGGRPPGIYWGKTARERATECGERLAIGVKTVPVTIKMNWGGFHA